MPHPKVGMSGLKSRFNSCAIPSLYVDRADRKQIGMIRQALYWAPESA